MNTLVGGCSSEHFPLSPRGRCAHLSCLSSLLSLCKMLFARAFPCYASQYLEEGVSPVRSFVRAHFYTRLSLSLRSRFAALSSASLALSSWPRASSLLSSCLAFSLFFSRAQPFLFPGSTPLFTYYSNSSHIRIV